MKRSTLIAVAALASSAYCTPDFYINPEPWAEKPKHKGGSGTGQTGLNVQKSRAAAKAARKARRKQRIRGKS